MTDQATPAPHAGAEPARRPWTVQCSFASYDANVVTVEAANPDEACARAIELANESDGWKSLDHCGDTFVDALAEGEDADPWAGGFTSAVPVPATFRERSDDELRAALIGLLDWAAMMGGWDAPAWREAERGMGRGDSEAGDEPAP